MLYKNYNYFRPKGKYKRCIDIKLILDSFISSHRGRSFHQIDDKNFWYVVQKGVKMNYINFQCCPNFCNSLVKPELIFRDI